MRRIALAIAVSLALPGTVLAQATSLSRIGGYSSGLGEGSIEISAFDPVSRRVASVNGSDSSFDLIDLSNPAAPVLVQRVSTAAFGSPNSVAISNGVLAVAIQDANPQNNGRVAFYSTNGALLGSVVAGALPDMLTFTPDGHYVLVANEGEPDTDYNVDPEGSVSIIDISAGIAAATVRQVRFNDFNVGGSRHGELPAAVRIFSPGATVAEDLEPEYISVTPDSRTAFVGLQEANALAVIDIASGTVSRILALGFKNHNLPNQGLDPSDRDLPGNQPAISIRNVPVFGMYQPDGIAVTTDSNGQPVVFTANEGDSRDYDAFSEEVRAGSGSYVLDPTVFPDAATLKQNANLGRLNVTKSLGDIDGDGDFDAIYAFGARSMSAFDGNSGALVFDSGDSFEQTIAAQVPTLFNSEGTTATFDGRSDNKGPEPEGIVIGDVGGRKYAFVGLERIGGAFVYDVTNPRAPVQLGYSSAQGGDVSPEGVAYIAPAQSPSQRALLLMSHEVSGTLGVYQVDTCTVSAIQVFAPDQIQISGYCPTGLDIYCVRQGTPLQVASGISVNTQTTATAALQFGDRCYASLPGQNSAINGIQATLDRVPIPATHPLGSLLLALISMLLGVLTLRRQVR
ncbi:MAG: choice-of-anchor I family protein [Lysobacterales bacterium]